ncbi:hypothetical protein WMY93_033607 [Mugilogobius chulae]|uniref:Uncharacterized protein n=1 Tax=Mugilogobius chulae TaxID=88201 RepID=A0AAW0MSA5_9GOBI
MRRVSPVGPVTRVSAEGRGLSQGAGPAHVCEGAGPVHVCRGAGPVEQVRRLSLNIPDQTRPGHKRKERERVCIKPQDLNKPQTGLSEAEAELRRFAPFYRKQFCVARFNEVQSEQQQEQTLQLLRQKVRDLQLLRQTLQLLRQKVRHLQLLRQTLQLLRQKVRHLQLLRQNLQLLRQKVRDLQLLRQTLQLLRQTLQLLRQKVRDLTAAQTDLTAAQTRLETDTEAPPEGGEVLYEDAVFYFDETRKWRERYIVVRANYSLECHESLESFLKGGAPLHRLLPTGGAVLTTEEKYMQLVDQCFPDDSSHLSVIFFFLSEDHKRPESVVNMLLWSESSSKNTFRSLQKVPTQTYPSFSLVLRRTLLHPFPRCRDSFLFTSGCRIDETRISASNNNRDKGFSERHPGLCQAPEPRYESALRTGESGLRRGESGLQRGKSGPGTRTKVRVRSAYRQVRSTERRVWSRYESGLRRGKSGQVRST